MSRSYRCVPPPHGRVHEKRGRQSPTVQLIGHGMGLQPSTCFSDGQVKPPLSGWNVMVRDRVRVPPAHVLVQPPHSPHGATLQCTGQGPFSHLRVSLSSPHARPPFSAGWTTVRWRLCTPELHVTEHGRQLPHGDC